jgi:hypothetical protein
LNLRRHRAELVCYVLAGALVPAVLLVYVAAHHALAAALDDFLWFTAQRYARIQSVRFSSGADTQNLPLRYLFPLAGLLALVVCAREWRTCLRNRLLQSCAAFGLAGFVGCFPRPDMVHIAFTSPLACPLLAYCATRLTLQWRPAYRYVVVAAVIGLFTPSLRSFLSISRQALHAEIVPTPRGGVAFVGQPSIRELLARVEATPFGDAYFFYPYMPMLPFLTAREDVSRYDILVPGYTLPSQYQDACLSAMRHASWVVIDRRWTDPDLWKRVFPAMQEAEPQETKRFEQALNSGFEFIAQEGPFELRHRLKNVNDTVCTKIME